MVAEGRGSKMPCESCAVQFSVFKRKRVCSECERYYCSGCLRRGGGAMCAPCRVLSTRPLSRNTIAHLKVRDLQCFLHRQNVSTRGCVEKDELVSLCVSHVNSASYRRRGAGAGRGSGAFSSLKGFTNNINDFINSAFDLRTAHPAHPPPASCQTSNCFNSSHIHSPAGTEAPQPRQPDRAQNERFTPTPGGERDIRPEVPPTPAETDTPSSGSDRIETADCFEIEDLDDAGWEFVTRPADPLPNDSDVLLSATECRRQSEPRQAADPARPAELPARPERHSTPSTRSAGSDFERIPDLRNQRPTISRDYLTPGLSANELSPGLSRARASSELELRSAAAAGDDDTADTNSLQDEPLHSHTQPGDEESALNLERMSSEAELDRLTVKQLKQLLARNRVEYRGCLERGELLERARLLFREHALYRDAADSLPLEECCKICMAAPLECVLLECGHIAACTACSKQLAECPICRQYVVRAVRFFRS